MWLVYLKVLYDSSTIVKVLIWAFIAYVVGSLLYELWGWAGVVILILAFIAMVGYIVMPSKSQRRYKKRLTKRKNVKNKK